MKSPFPMRPLSAALQRVERSEEVNSGGTYRMLGVRSFGRGAFAANDLKGIDTRYRKLLRVESDDLVYPKLMAWEGAFARVTAGLSGRFVSPEFCTFQATEEADSRFVEYALRTPWIAEAVAGSSGGTNLRRRRLYPDGFLKREIPLPDIDEQRRIAAHLDRASKLATRACELRERSARRTTALHPSLAAAPQVPENQREASGWRLLALENVMVPAAEWVTVEPFDEYPNLGIYSFGRGVFHKPPIDGLSTSAKRLYRVRRGQFIYSRLFAFEGAYAYVPSAFDGHFVSNEFPVFDVDPDFATAEYIASVLRSPDHWGALAGSSKGLGLRRQRIKADALLQYEIWLPPVHEQDRIVAGLRKVRQVEEGLERSVALIKALMPSALNRAFAGLA